MYRAEKESQIHLSTSCEPNFVILIFIFSFIKSQITKFGGGTEKRLPELPAQYPAWYIGVVMHWRF